jgi:hypothetical protein
VQRRRHAAVRAEEAGLDASPAEIGLIDGLHCACLPAGDTLGGAHPVASTVGTNAHEAGPL